MEDRSQSPALSARPTRPRPAASLLLLWQDTQGACHILMGRRHPSLAFMPNYLVFPGGRVEGTDNSQPIQLRLEAPDSAALAHEQSKSPQAFLQTALRECLEETGFDVASTLKAPLHYIARAVTPPRLSKRYDTRFLLSNAADNEALAKAADKVLPAGDGELLSCAWHPVNDLASEPLHHVTRAVLGHAMSMAAALGSKREPPARMLVANRTPRHWTGAAAIRSEHLRQQSQRLGS